MPDNKKGYKTWTADVEGYGTIRVQVPSRISAPEDVKPFFDAELERRDQLKTQKESSKEVVQPLSKEQYPGTEGPQPPLEYGEEVLKNLPGSAGRSLKALVTNPFQGFGNEEVAPVNYPEGFQPNYTPTLSALGHNIAQLPENMPVVGSIMRGARGELSPEEASDLVLQAIGVAGGRVAPKTLIEAPQRFGNAMSRVASDPWGYSRAGRSIGQVAGMGAGAGIGTLFGRGNPYLDTAIGYRAGGDIGARVPGAVGAFKRGYGEPIAARPAPPVVPPRPPASSAYGMPPALPAPGSGPIVTPPPSPAGPPALLNPGFSERLQNLKKETAGKQFSQLPPDEPLAPKGETADFENPHDVAEGYTLESKGKVNLSSVKKAAKTHNMSVEETAQQLKDAGYEVSRSQKIRRH